VSLTTSSVRALAASIAIVASGATFAGAAVFHLPVLGFGRTGVASAAAPATTAATIAKPRVHKVRPKVIVKTKIVTDIVHRPAPVSAAVHAGWTSAPTVAAPATLPVPVPAAPVTPVVTTPSAAPAWSEPEVAETHHHEVERDDAAAEHETHAAAPAGATTTTTTSPVVDR
jgi:hypothetical protein